MNIALAADDESIARCHTVMVELRPHLGDTEAFVEQVRRQQIAHGYQLAFLSSAGVITAVAGFRIFECLAWGKTLYVDDLVTAETVRSKGHGGELFNWLVAYARAAGCDQFHLDSGVHRAGAHRFYFAKRMTISSFHFGMAL